MLQKQIHFKTSHTMLRWKEILFSSGFSSTLRLWWNLQQQRFITLFLQLLMNSVFYNVVNEEADRTWLVCVGWSCCTGGRGSWDGGGLSKTATWKQGKKILEALSQGMSGPTSSRGRILTKLRSETHVRNVRGDFKWQHL